MLAKPTALRKHRRKVLRAPHLDPKEMIGVDALRTFPGVSNGIPCRVVGHHITKGYTVEFSDGEQEVVKDANELRVLSALPLENIKRKRDGGDTRQEDATLFRMAPYQGITWKPKERDDIEVYMDALQIICDRQVVLVRSKRSFVKTFGRSDFPGRMRGSQSMRTGGIATSSNSSWRAYVPEAELGRAQQIAWDCIRRCLARVLENARIVCHPDLVPDSHSIVEAAGDEDLGFSMLKTMRKLDFGGRSSIKSRRSFRKLSAEEQNRYTNLGKDLRQVVASDTKAAKKSREHVSSQLDNLFGPGPPPMLLPDSRSALKVQVHRLEMAVKSIHWLYLSKLFGVTPTKTDSAFEVRRASWTLLRNSDERADLCDLAVRLKKAYILIDGECRAHLKMRQLRGAALKRLWDALDHLDDDGDFVDHAASNAIFDEITRSLGARRSWEELDSAAYHARRAEAARRALMRVFLTAEEKKLRHIIYVATYMRASKLQMEKLRAVHLDTKLVHRYAILRTEHVLKTYGVRPTSLPTRNQVQTIDDALGVVYSQQGTRDWWDAAAHMDDLGCQLPISKTTEDADSQESDEAGFDSRPAAEKTVAKHPVSAERHESSFPSASGSLARKSVSSEQKSIFAPSSDEDDSEHSEASGVAKEKEKTKKNKGKLETRKTKRAVDSSLSAANSDDSGDEDKGEAHDSSDEEEDQLARASRKTHPSAPGKAPKKAQPHRSTTMYDSSDEDEEDDDKGDGRKGMRSIATSNAVDEDFSAAEEDSSDAEVHRLGKRKSKAAFDDSDDDDSQANHDSSSKKMDKKNKHKKEPKKKMEKKKKRRKTTDSQASPDTISFEKICVTEHGDFEQGRL
ncbi:Hypothetical Protein FCC1311_076012 [Hondaea fermentalgiana]|uniref:Uncharacterized protein n=1 Tax=Hondaea fermentalgiana TaxID=2315210 RepID=A0A2R5GKG9_9STRA|nr:Hypothetical Protein FCC1311_076012 [Hondaea fermentalgiana]|eukprot:GBG31377.1 Hypothetical Protein FCC1311_076012 [Hondaea fermentalgiana]